MPRTGTRYTKTLHRFRLRLYALNHRVPDVTVRAEEYLPNPDVKTTHNDWYVQAWETEFGEFLFGTPTDNTPEEATVTEVTYKTEVVATATENELKSLMGIKHPPTMFCHLI